MLKSYRRILFFLITVLLMNATVFEAAAQQGGRGLGGMDRGRGMGMGPMGGGQMNIPDKLPTPKNQEWIAKLREILAMEKLSVAQYEADQAKFQASTPYPMVTRQEQWHVDWITALFKAYGLPAEVKSPAIIPTRSLKEAFEVCIKLENDLIAPYEWLISKAEDQTSAQVLDRILRQTRMHQRMFQHHLQMLGGG